MCVWNSTLGKIVKKMSLKRKLTEIVTCNKKFKYGSLSDINNHKKDKYIKFVDDSHTYSIDWLKIDDFQSDGVRSVTQVVKSFFNEFDPDMVITKMMKHKNWKKSKYFGMSPKNIKDLWSQIGREASAMGTYQHSVYEDFYNGTIPSKPYSKCTEQFLEFVDDHKHWDVFRTEWKIYTDSKTKICGSADILFFNPNFYPSNSNTLHLILCDWKHCKKIKRFGFSNGKPPFQDLTDSNYFHYALQLNMYRFIIENYYENICIGGKTYENIKIDKTYIICMHDNQKSYTKMLLPDYQERIKHLFELPEFHTTLNGEAH